MEGRARASPQVASPYAMSGTATSYRATPCPAISGTGTAYRATHVLCHTRVCCYQYAPPRRPSNSSDPGPLSAYANAIRCPVLAFSVRACYAKSGTDLQRMRVLCEVRYLPSVWCALRPRRQPLFELPGAQLWLAPYAWPVPGIA
eukprot:2059117-Rhodomonas_salina.6